MDLENFVKRVTHAAGGVPRLTTAAVKAGVGPSGAVDVLRISEGALRLAATKGAGERGLTNAMRHFMWQALLTARFGREVAQSIAAAQEEDSPTPEDSRVDAHNNAVGQGYGEANAKDLSDQSIDDALEALVPVALAKWETDELIWVRPH